MASPRYCSKAPPSEILSPATVDKPTGTSMPRHPIAEVLAHGADDFVGVQVAATSVPEMVEGLVHNKAPQSELAPSLVTLVA